MTDLELKEKAFAIGDLIRDTNISDEAMQEKSLNNGRE